MLSQAQVPIAEKVDKKATAAPCSIKVIGRLITTNRTGQGRFLGERIIGAKA